MANLSKFQSISILAGGINRGQQETTVSYETRTYVGFH